MPLRILLALVAGAVLSLAFEPVTWPFVAPVAVAALVGCVRGLGPRRAWLPGLAFGVGFEFVLQWWMRAVGTDAWLALSALEASFFAVLGSATALLLRRRWWPFWVALAWVAAEVWRGSWPFGGMPWGRLAFSVVDTPFASALPYVGANGVSLLLALLGTVLAWVVLEGRRASLRVGSAAIVPPLLALSPVVAPYAAPTAGTVRIAAVQGNVPGDGSDILLDHRQVTRNHVDATLRLADRIAAGETARPDFVLWPENSTAVDPFTDAGVNADLVRASDAIGLPILVGGIVDAPRPGDVLNQGIVWEPGTGPGDRYTKRHPVPFGEYIPWRDKVFKSNFGKLALVSRDMLSGTRAEPLTVAGIQVADAICFDIAYDDGLRTQIQHGAQVLVVQTSNATFIHTDQIKQQFAITRLRAIETHRSVVVAATNGQSGVIDPSGRVVEALPPRTQDVLVAEVALAEDVTPGLLLGPWIGRGAVLLTLLGCAVALFPYRRSRQDSVQAVAGAATGRVLVAQDG